MEDYILEMKDITKVFPGIIANDNISLQVRKREVHALLGENGAGKSTLMNVLFGLYRPESGNILIEGKPIKINNPNDARRYGIGMVHQHFKLVHNFTALQNIVLGSETCKKGFVDLEEDRKKINQILKKYKLNIDLDMIIEDMTVAMQQRVEIVKMLYHDSDILIFDEPTAVLVPQEVEELMKCIEELVHEGKSVIFISHKLKEIMRIADRCTVLRRGKVIGTVNINETTKEELSEMMVGRKVLLNPIKSVQKRGELLMSVKNLTIREKGATKSTVNNVSFNLYSGEILCIAGVDGNGQRELINGITGLCDIEEGSIQVKDKECSGLSIRERNESFFSHIPEDRQKHGLLLDFTVAENMIIKNYYKKECSNRGLIDYKKIYDKTEGLIKKYDIRASQGAYTLARSLSGGNQQKAIVARELDNNSDILIAVQPTRGMDVGAIEFIHKQLISMRDKGKGILLVSLELEEVLSISDRIIVIYEGEIVGEVYPENVDLNELGLLMTGGKRNDYVSTKVIEEGNNI